MGGGRVMCTPPVDGDEVMGQVVRSWLMRDWAQSRAVVARRASGGLGGRGEGSWQRRLPRSKVGGMGFVMVGELVREVLVRLGVYGERELRFGWLWGAGG